MGSDEAGLGGAAVGIQKAQAADARRHPAFRKVSNPRSCVKRGASVWRGSGCSPRYNKKKIKTRLRGKKLNLTHRHLFVRSRHHAIVCSSPWSNSVLGIHLSSVLARSIDRIEVGTSIGRPGFQLISSLRPSLASSAAMISRRLRPRPEPMLNTRASLRSATAYPERAAI